MLRELQQQGPRYVCLCMGVGGAGVPTPLFARALLVVGPSIRMELGVRHHHTDTLASACLRSFNLFAGQRGHVNMPKVHVQRMARCTSLSNSPHTFGHMIQCLRHLTKLRSSHQTNWSNHQSLWSKPPIHLVKPPILLVKPPIPLVKPKPLGQTTKTFGQTTNPFGQTTTPLGQTTKNFNQTTNPSGPTTNPFGQTITPRGQTTKTFSLNSPACRAILFIDDIHTITGPNAQQGGGVMDASVMLKPLLSR